MSRQRYKDLEVIGDATLQVGNNGAYRVVSMNSKGKKVTKIFQTEEEAIEYINNGCTIPRNKYNVRDDKEKRTSNGILFDSVLEKRYYDEVLCPLVESGDIVDYELQKVYVLQPEFIRNNKKVKAITYVADFFMKFKDGHELVVDTKGCPDQKALVKRKMFWYVFPDVDYRWMVCVKKFGGWLEYDECKKLRRAEKNAKKKLMEEKGDT